MRETDEKRWQNLQRLAHGLQPVTEAVFMRVQRAFHLRKEMEEVLHESVYTGGPNNGSPWSSLYARTLFHLT